HIVAICADEEVEVGDLHELVRRAYPFADLSRAQLENVLDMLAGRYPSDEFAELRPRIIWDRTAGVLRGRPGARRLAVTNAGTIPDRGLFGVFIAGESGGRVGELDEEMVYEARAGQVIVLGASSWRIEEITRDRCAPVRPHCRRRAVPGRDRRLARLHPHAVRRARARAVGDGGRRSPARVARPRGAVDLVGRRHRLPPARRRLAAGDRPARA